MAGTTAVILAAGEGRRMRSDRPKVLHEVAGVSLLAWVVDAAREAGPVDRVVCVVSPGRREEIERTLDDPGIQWAIQPEPRGTADALARALPTCEEADEIVCLTGDAPAIRASTIADLVTARREADAALAVLSARLDEPGSYGRVLRDEDGSVRAIVEASDATDEELAVREVNAGAYAIEADGLPDLLRSIEADNVQGERYLTDLVRLRIEEGRSVVGHVAPESREVLGVNTRSDLAEVGRVLTDRIIGRHLEAGVTVVDPRNTWIERDTEIGRDTVVHPFTVIRRGVRVGRGCRVGPFAHLRPGTVLEEGASVGGFVETKKARLGAGAKANHLAYLGDAEVGAGANVGAGTIFANYDGERKHRSTVGDGAFIGCNTVLVAPCRMEDRSRTGAGAILTRETVVPAGETWVGVPAGPLEPRDESRDADRRERPASGRGTS